MASRGKFISVESVDGGGKTTQIPFIADYLRSAGYEVIVTREPGGTKIGERIRDLLLHEYMTPMTELLLFNAARQELAELVIKPALARGAVVLSDRYLDSTNAYQGWGRGLKSEVTFLESFIADGIMPSYTLFFKISLEESLARINLRANKAADDRFETEVKDFKERVYNGYMNQASRYPDRIKIIDGLGDIETVRQRVVNWVEEVFIPNEPIFHGTIAITTNATKLEVTHV